MASNANDDVMVDLSPFIKVYRNGTVERLFPLRFVPPSPVEDPETGVSSKDTTISPEVSARLHLPKLKTPNQKLPLLVYYHGGGFCVGSAFEEPVHRYANILAAEASALVVSVEYRLAPEHPLPAAYEDSWVALNWVASHAADGNGISGIEKDPWLLNHGDFERVLVAGDSAGGNIAHNLAMRAAQNYLPGDVKISAAILAHPYFWGSKQTGSSVSTGENTEQNRLEHRIWMFVYPSAPDGIDNPMINPVAEKAESLKGLGCSRVFVCTAEKDSLRERILQYVEAVKESGWRGEIEVVDVDGEDHCFQLSDPSSEKSKDLIKRVASFIMQ